jgi:hypothetical protein
MVEAAEGLFDKAADYWKEAIRLAPNNYIEVQKLAEKSQVDRRLMCIFNY